MNEPLEARIPDDPTTRYHWRLEDDYGLSASEIEAIDTVIDSLEGADEETATRTLMHYVFSHYGGGVFTEALAQWKRKRWARSQKEFRELFISQALERARRSNTPFFTWSLKTIIFYPILLLFAILQSGFFGVFCTCIIFLVRRLQKYKEAIEPCKTYLGQCAELAFFWFIQFMFLMLMLAHSGSGLISLHD